MRISVTCFYNIVDKLENKTLIKLRLLPRFVFYFLTRQATLPVSMLLATGGTVPLSLLNGSEQQKIVQIQTITGLSMSNIIYFHFVKKDGHQ